MKLASQISEQREIQKQEQPVQRPSGRVHLICSWSNKGASVAKVEEKGERLGKLYINEQKCLPEPRCENGVSAVIKGERIKPIQKSN